MMRKKGDKDSFWPSYVDVVTTLFAIMVVLFAVSYSRFRATMNEWENIKAINEMVKNINSTYFAYDTTYVKHIFKIQVTYQTGEFDLYRLQADLTNRAEADALRDSIKKAGEEIKRAVKNLQENEKLQEKIKKNIKYLVVVEGQASKIQFNVDSWRNNNTLSYLRALYLSEYWKKQGIDFSKMDKCELVVSGSGEGGVPRDAKREENNQRFLIHIVPVIGNIRLDAFNENVVNGIVDLNAKNNLN